MFPSFLLVPLVAGALNTAPTSAIDSLLTPAEQTMLEQELRAIEPPERLQKLAGYSAWQLELGGGFYGLLPDQLGALATHPTAVTDKDRQDILLLLGRQRAENRESLRALNPDYAVAFQGQPLAEFLQSLAEEPPAPEASAAHLQLTLDISVPLGFFAAHDDGEITADEALALARLPANQAMLQHRQDLGYVPPPLPNTQSLARMIRMAGSPDPLDRIWCWVNSQNAFDYADLVQNADAFGAFIDDLENHQDLLTSWVEDRVRPFCPDGTEVDATFALTVGWAIRGWVTPDMAGLNIEQVKDDWRFLLGTMVEETYHRVQLEIFPSDLHAGSRDFESMVTAQTGDPRFDKLYSLVAHTVAEGSANRVRGPLADPDLTDKVDAGRELVDRFVQDVVQNGQVDAADALLGEGLKGNGPLYGLGWRMADLIVQADGPAALGAWQRKGPTRFILRAQAIADDRGVALLSPETMAAIRQLDKHL